ncbi:MmcQ/YjbR family DNA-binding protein [Dysgonomonas macrotermitis]|uniref:Predicted DNA-binding protein, MmcQ/YjbR family n=1 Tax=Dysgonomonas macrotermitis TaxID=1346286 RepID=A0A1M4WZ05_9BACT|nr:MmcQ/YjbR family DNA-binding protein [Dysgonomonas macrotermitis]SHE86367.1 Predicted DNA-binding protein, MmcQ/YjbR family [Dysgonomonas macrotermitis]
MNIEDFREYCLSFKGTSESFPFLDKNILVFKVMDKMFVYGSIFPKDGKIRMSMKCNRDYSVELRDKYSGVQTGDHTRDLSWNSIYIESDIPDTLIKELVAHSLQEVINGMTKKKQAEYNNLR